MRGEVAGIVDLAGRGLVGHRLRRNEVLAPDRIRRHAEFSRGGIDQPLDHVGRLGTAGAAIGVDRHGVGEHGADAAVEGLDVVEPGQHAGAAMRNVGPEGREIGAHVAHQVDVHAQELAVLGQRHLRGRDVVAALRVAHEVIGAVGGPFDGLAQLSARRPQSARIRDRETVWCRSRRRRRDRSPASFPSASSAPCRTGFRAGDGCPGCRSVSVR